MSKEYSNKTSPVLLMVDDDEEDVYLTRRAFCAYQTDLVFNSVSNSECTFDYLYSRGEFEERNNSEAPHVILLDINIPVENGFEILKKLKEDPNHAQIPVVMLSTSKAQQDIDKALSLGAVSYITKPVNTSGMKQIAEEFCQYWFGAEKLTASQ